MGNGYGPVFITKDSHGLYEGADDLTKKNWLLGKKIAVPGRMTSAFRRRSSFSDRILITSLCLSMRSLKRCTRETLKSA